MFSTTFLLTLVTVTASLLSSTSAAPVDSSNGTSGPVPSGKRLIVTLKDGSQRPKALNVASSSEELQVVNSYFVNPDEVSIDQLRADPDVESVEEDGPISINAVQTDAPWGLARLSSRNRLPDQDASHLTFRYEYSHQAGRGVDIYVVDTGIRTTHNEFGGRARWGATFGGYPDADGNGHGTHCAATAAGRQFGVAKQANLIAVKVLGDNGRGVWSDFISGLNYVYNQARMTNRPSVVSLSLGGPPNNAADKAVRNLIRAGVHVIVAAGNNNDDAKNHSPARVSSALTVGASDIADTKAWFSNYGRVVDVFAPGVNVISAWYTSDSATNTISGTSMATPHVSGLVAYLISIEGNKRPSTLIRRVKKLSEKGDLSGLPSGTHNRLAHNDH